MTTMTTTPDPAEVAARLRAVLAAVRAGELDASGAYRARLEGAVLALDLVDGNDLGTVLARLQDDPVNHRPCN